MKTSTRRLNRLTHHDWSALSKDMREIHEMFKENERRMKETDRQMKETDRQMKDTDRRMKETDRQLKETKELIKALSTKFTSQSGHILEGLMEPSAIRMFQERGYNINRCWKNFKKYSKSAGRRMEVDLLLLDDEIAIVVEVKINCTCADVDHFLEQMAHFKEVCHEYADKRVLVAVAAVNYDRDSAEYAHQKGMFVIRVHNDNIFSLDPTDGDILTEF